MSFHQTKTKPIISIIIPTFNEEKSIATCLKSIKKQNIDLPYEIIIIDHKSSDNTVKLAKSFTSSIYNEKKSGTGPARIKGVKKAKGAIIVFTEADCIFPKNWLKTLTKPLLSKQYIATSGNFRIHPQSNLDKFANKLFINLFTNIYYFFRGHQLFRGKNCATLKTSVTKTSWFKNPKIYYDDVQLGQDLARQGEILYLDQLKVLSSNHRHNKRTLPFIFEFIFNYFFSLKHKSSMKAVR